MRKILFWAAVLILPGGFLLIGAALIKRFDLVSKSKRVVSKLRRQHVSRQKS